MGLGPAELLALLVSFAGVRGEKQSYDASRLAQGRRQLIGYQALLQEADVRPLARQDLSLPSLPADGRAFLEDIGRELPGANVAHIPDRRICGGLELSSYAAGSSAFYAARKIRLLLWDGDLLIDGDLIDDDFSIWPMMIVRGNLHVRSWLRGGMCAFVGGSITASGFVVGHYDDSALFVGGSLAARGYVPCVGVRRDRQEMEPHQIGGSLDARRFDARNAEGKALERAFVDEVLGHECDDEGDFSFLEPRKVVERAAAGLSVWRDTGGDCPCGLP